MTNQGGPYDRSHPGDATRSNHPGETRRRVPLEPSEAPWVGASPAGRPGHDPGAETAIIHLGQPGPAGKDAGSGGGTSVPIYFRAHFEPRPPSYTAKIVAIYGLTLALQVVLFVVYGDSPTFLTSFEQSQLWWGGTNLLLLFLMPALSGIVVDHPESVWARRWMYVTYFGCALVWVCGVASLFLQLV